MRSGWSAPCCSSRASNRQNAASSAEEAGLASFTKSSTKAASTSWPDSTAEAARIDSSFSLERCTNWVASASISQFHRHRESRDTLDGIDYLTYGVALAVAKIRHVRGLAIFQDLKRLHVGVG